MATLKLYLDRRAKQNGLYPLRVALTHRSSTTYISVGFDLAPEQWDAVRCKVKNHPQKLILNQLAQQKLMTVQIELLQLVNDGRCKGLTATGIRRLLMERLDPDADKKVYLTAYMEKHLAKKKALRTRIMYQNSLRKLRELRPYADRLTFEDVTPEFLRKFDADMEKQGLSQNTRSLYIKEIKAVFNAALDEELTLYSPFRKYKLHFEETRKRSLSVERLRAFFKCEPQPRLRIYRDIFKLMFFLIGINIKDLTMLRATDYADGRIRYHRAKTGRLYDIKVEPEAAEIIERYRANDGLLLNMHNRKLYTNFSKLINVNIKKFEYNGEVVCPELSTYYARHTWATIAASLDIPKETIAAALGHGSKTVTDIYIDFDQKKVDAANRKVIDYVLEVQNI
jgi:site-specific recombinase XerD